MPVLLAPPLAFGPFISGAMLLWGLVAAVPVVLHFLNRRRRQTVAWPAMQFLLQSLQRRSRNIQLWQWLLLLCRVAAVLLIAAALANPVLNQLPPATALQRPGEHHLIVIDASYSMHASGASGNSRFQVAIERAVQYCQRAADGDSFRVVVMQAEPLAVISRPSLEVSVVQQELQRLQPSFTDAPLAPTLSLIRGLVPEAEPTPSHLLFFTDAQQTTWQAALDGDSQNAWQQLRQRFASVRIVDVTQDDPPAAFNATLTDLEAATSDRVSVVTTAFENQHAAAQLDVSVGGESIYSNRLQWNDADRVVTDVPLPVADQAVVVKASLADDVLQTDNTRWLVRRPAKPLRALCVGSSQATRFVAVALSTAGQQRWDVHQVPVDQLFAEGPEAVEPIDLLMICDVPRIATPLLETLRRVQRHGGGVVWWLGPQVEPAGYDSAAVPFALASPSQSDLYSIDPRGYQHPIAAAFAPYPQSGLLSTPIFRYWQLADSGPHVDADVVLGLGVESEPFVLAQQVAAKDSQHSSVSRTVVITSIPMVANAAGSETPWNAMVAWPSLVPLVQEIAAWATAPLQASPAILVGDSISGTVAQRDQVPLRVLAPDDQTLDVRSTALETGFGGFGDFGTAWTAGTATQPGVYTLEYSDQPPQQWAVNVDPREGDLRPSEIQSLQKLDDTSTENTPTRSANTPAADGLAGEDGDDAQWFRWLLAAAMGLLITESLISRFALRWQA